LEGIKSNGNAIVFFVKGFFALVRYAVNTVVQSISAATVKKERTAIIHIFWKLKKKCQRRTKCRNQRRCRVGRSSILRFSTTRPFCLWLE